MKNDQTYLQHIFEAIETVGSYIKNENLESFEAKGMIVDAVIR